MFTTFSCMEKNDSDYNELDKLISSMIKKIISRRKLKKSEVAEQAGIPNGYFSELINLQKKKRWNTDTILGVAKTLDVHPCELLMDPNTREAFNIWLKERDLKLTLEGLKKN